jgi:hypothetical protein
MRQALEVAGYAPTDNPHTADVLLAHSGGCLLVPADTQAKLILNVGYTYWPGRPLALSHAMNARQQFMSSAARKQLLSELGWGFVYIAHFAHTLRLVKAWPRRQKKLTSADGRFVFVRNRHDSFCAPHMLISLTPHSSLVSLPGDHNDLWHHPEVYINLLESELYE